jgi:hypothetical protein
VRAADGDKAWGVKLAIVRAERPDFGEAEAMAAASRMKSMHHARGYRVLEAADELRDPVLDAGADLIFDSLCELVR